MSASSSPTRGRASANGSSSKTYDEEQLRWASPTPRWSAWPKKLLRLFRLRRVGVCLLIIDIIITLALVHMFGPLIELLNRNEEIFGARLSLPTDTQELKDVPQTIPRIFHQTAKNEEIRDDWVESHKSCQEAYKDYEYKLWTDDLAREFIAKEYDWFLDTWDNFPFPIQRADAIRYFVLYHYGGLYLDMDTWCNRTLPLDQIEAQGGDHHSVFKSTTPTGVSNDFLIASPHHPAYAAALNNIEWFNHITKSWAKWLPHAAIMISAGPFFITMVLKRHLLELPSLPTTTFSVINATELEPYITDLEGQSWHHSDTQTLMWVGDRPWVWFTLGAIGLAIGLHAMNYVLVWTCKYLWKRPSSSSSNEEHEYKEAKLT